MFYQDYCTGCGLCASECAAKIQTLDNGLRVIATADANGQALKDICPAGGRQCAAMASGKVWGRTKKTYLAYSTNPQTRFAASSGGVLTELACFLLDTKMVDGILQTKAKKGHPIETETVCSTTKEQVLACSGSRYSASMPLADIHGYIGKGKKYAFIGKPCDVTALHNWMEKDPIRRQSIPYLLSFFCAGAPSKDANLELLRKLECTEETCVSMQYRGNGWPGYATAVDSNGNSHQITYQEAWKNTLGRDIRKMCRFCLDGIGELADVSCADAWYLDENKKVSFKEADGRNVVFCRTEKGADLLEAAAAAGYLETTAYDGHEDEIGCYQAYQRNRRTTMRVALMAMQMFGRAVPKYDKKLLKSYEQTATPREKFNRFKGTVRRIIEGKI